MEFLIEWDDPETGERQKETKNFRDTSLVKAEEWAEDYAYAKADKGWHRVTST